MAAGGNFGNKQNFGKLDLSSLSKEDRNFIDELIEEKNDILKTDDDNDNEKDKYES